MSFLKYTTFAKALDEATDSSQSFVSRRHPPSQARVRSTTRPWGGTSNPLAVSDRLMTSTLQLRRSFSAPLRFSRA